ncbi:hypothetical protein F5884DRAFT_666234 [Xylogone sp. PMI_703]|nr:hypothetical protein F5884DRAFT_666234 [Xylogone sp. PMI_703]
MTSRDGYVWTESEGLKAGVPSIGVIQPASNLKSASVVYDVVIVGAGYAGLTAARDATISGLKVLLLEARDRIGGRSWSSNIGGYPFEMGGTWVHWGQPHIWREISRYQMKDQIEISYDFSRGINQYLLVNPDGTQKMTHDEEDALMESGLRKLVNVDGKYGRNILPFPHDEFHNPEVRKYDTMTVAQRIAEIKDSLTPNERTAVESFVLLCGGGTLETTSFFEFLHWWALCGYTYEGCIEYLAKYKFRFGQSSFAIKFFQEALETGNLEYSFNTPIARVQNGQRVEVTARDGRTFKASRMISAIPLNVLNDVVFDPPISAGKKAAASIGHINQCTKVHAEIRNRDLRSWTGISYPHNHLIYGFADGTTPSGNTHVVCFGAKHNHFHPEDDIKVTQKAFQTFVPMDIEKIIFHNWSRDEFAKGAWFFSPPELVTKYLEDLRARQGNVFFASSDWALGWRSFIDGAIEEGTRAARAVKLDLVKPKSQL